MSNSNDDTQNPRKPDQASGDKLTATATTTTVHEETQTDTAAEPARLESGRRGLTPLEEKVIRMLHGKSLAGHEALEFAPGASMETRLKLALIEANLLEAFEAEAVDTDPTTGAVRSVIADELER